MGSLNRVIITGRLTHDPEIRYTTKKQHPVAHFSLAVNRNKEETDFINCVAWNGLAKICGEFLKKGRLVAVEGRLQIRKYETKDGNKKTAVEIIANNMQMLDSKFSKAAEKEEKAEELIPV